MVETISFVGRTGNLYLYALGKTKNELNLSFQPNDMTWLKTQSMEALKEASQSLKRAERSSDKISQLLSGSKETAWFQTGKNGYEFVEAMGLPRFIDFLKQNLNQSDDIRYGEYLERLKEVLKNNSG